MALFNLAFAQINGGDFLLRIEDTDRNRYAEGSEQMIFDALHWLDLNYNEVQMLVETMVLIDSQKDLKFMETMQKN